MDMKLVERDMFFLSLGKSKIKKDLESYKNLLMEWRKNNKIIGFTNGCFDILHSGHIDYLTKAKNKVDILIVAINTDLSVKMNKGPERPFRSLEDRKFVLENLKPVDLVIPFNDKSEIWFENIKFSGSIKCEKLEEKIDVLLQQEINSKNLSNKLHDGLNKKSENDVL